MSDTNHRENVSPPCDRRNLPDDAGALLGPCRPLPALVEEGLRALRGLPARTERLRKAERLRERLTAAVLMSWLDDPAISRAHRLLAGALLMATPDALAGRAAPQDSLPRALARFGDPTDVDWLEAALPDARLSSPAALPDPLALLAFLKGLHLGCLSDAQFAGAVLDAGVLHPDVARHRPLRLLGRLLDYLGFHRDIAVIARCRALARDVWPTAATANWARWAWITLPGGPDVFPTAIRALASGELTLMRLHELRFGPLPAPDALRTLFGALDPAIALLAGWLRPELRPLLAALPAMTEGFRWITSANARAAEEAYARPPWWEAWLRDGYPAAAGALAWLQALPLPDLAPWGCSRHAWLERYLLPDYPAICRNLLLAHAAAGRSVVTVRALAADGDLPALRALGCAAPDEETLAVLQRVERDGGRPAQAAARAALDRQASRLGLPGRDELARQQWLAQAWEDGPLFDAPVRVGWEAGLYRLRLSLHRGQVMLEALGPTGVLPRIPAELRRGEAYAEARAARQEARERYRLFRAHLERAMLDGAPMPAGQFRFLLANPLFSHLAERLVWRGAGGDAFLWAAPDRWETLDGDPVEPTEGLTLSLVHPITLSADGRLAAWQQVAAERQLVQPFKQLFREVYARDGESGTRATRFAGRKIDPRRAYALLKAAGYTPGSGVARREWPGGVTAHLCWADGARGRDLFGPHALPAAITGAIWFTRDDAALPLHRVDAIVFSETLRAADLLTTRAAVGDADFTSRETVALRATLLRQLARSFRLTNIAVPEDGRFAVVLGARATYRLNLANGAVLLEPEGRQILLPRADPRWLPAEERDATTDILATAVTLANDGDVMDLTFLAQL